VPDSALIDKAYLAFANRHRNGRIASSSFVRQQPLTYGQGPVNAIRLLRPHLFGRI